MLDLTRLRVLVALARTGSVTAAARELHYSQPSVSHHLARLESETGAKLVQRAGRGVRLTEAGRQLAERGAEILGRMEAAEAELAAHVGLRQGRVRLAAFPSALRTFVPAAAARLAAGHPGLELRLTEAEVPDAFARAVRPHRVRAEHRLHHRRFRGRAGDGRRRARGHHPARPRAARRPPSRRTRRRAPRLAAVRAGRDVWIAAALA